MNKYVIIALCILSLFLGFKTMSLENSVSKLKGEVALLEKERDLALDVIKKNAEAMANYRESCEGTVDVLRDQLDKEKANRKARESTLEALSKKSPATLPTKPKEVTDEATGGVFDLDPDYVRLLNAAYCQGNGDDPYCSTGGTVDGVQQTNESVRK